jgi:hypothetical protein
MEKGVENAGMMGRQKAQKAQEPASCHFQTWFGLFASRSDAKGRLATRSRTRAMTGTGKYKGCFVLSFPF